MYTIPRKILEKKQSINLFIEIHAKSEKSTSAIQYYTQVILVGLTDVHGYNIISTKKRVYKGERRPTKFRRTFSTNLALKQAQAEEIKMEVDEQLTLSENEQIEAAAASGAAAAAADEAAYNLLWRALACSGVHWRALACTGVLWRALTCSFVHWCALSFSGVLCYAELKCLTIEIHYPTIELK
jgi:hypothetical protein